MSRSIDHVYRSHAAVIKRVFWLAMIASHAPAVWMAWAALLTGGGTRPDPFNLIGLTIASVFFALKLADVRWLRFQPGWRAAIALSLAVVLVHAGALELAPADTLTPQFLAAISGTLLLEPVQRRWQRQCELMACLQPFRRRKPVLLHPTAYARCHDGLRLPQWFVARAAAPPRAPPA